MESKGRLFDMKRYEYKVVAIPTTLSLSAKQYEKTAQELQEQLNELGANGWELVQRVDGFFFFKREKE